MATSTAQDNSIENSFDGRFDRLGVLREDSLGTVYQAYDRRPDAYGTGRPLVAVLRVKSLITRLPQTTQNRLQAAVKEAAQKQSDSLLKVLDYKLEGNGADWFIVMEWANDLPLPQWLAMQTQPVDPEKLIQLVILLAQKLLDFAQQGYQWTQPEIDPNKIYLRPTNTDAADLWPLFGDWGFARLLLDQQAVTPTSSVTAIEQVAQLGRLLAVLLVGDFTLWQERWSDDAVFTRHWQATKHRYPQLSEHLRTVLKRALAITPAAPYANLVDLITALQTAPSQPASKPAKGWWPTWGAKTETASPAEEPTATPPLPPVNPQPAPLNPLTARLRSTPSTPTVPTVDSSAPPLHYRLVVTEVNSGTHVQSFLLQQELITAGGGNDHLQLSGVEAQRLYFVAQKDQHGRPTGNYTVTDTGGDDYKLPMALLDEAPLSPYYAALFLERTPLLIGDYRIELLPPELATTMRPARQIPPLQVPLRTFAGQAGERIAIQVITQNQNKEVDHFRLVVDGAPAEWRLLIPPQREFFEGESADQSLVITLPAVQRSVAQIYTLTIRLISVNLRAQVAATTVQVELLPAYDYVGGLTPEQLRAGRPGELYIENHGNLTRVFRLSWRDRAKALLFEPMESTLMVRPGEVGIVTFAAYPRRWRLFGREEQYSISVLATPQNGGLPQSYSGQVLARALIPGWAPVLLLAVLAALFLAASLFLRPSFAYKVIEPSGVAIAGQPFTLYWTPVNACFYAVYQDGNPQQPLTWQTGNGFFRVANAAPDSMIEIRLRNCLLMAEETWPVTVRLPAATPIPPPQIITYTLTLKDAITSPLRLLQNQEGNLCLRWEVSGAYTKVQLDPPLGAIKDLADPKGKECLPIAEVFPPEMVEPSPATNLYTFTLKVAYGDEQAVSATPVPATILVEQAVCYVNTNEPLRLFDGPGDEFPVRVELPYNTKLLPQARPFAPLEQGGDRFWVQVKLVEDPRPGWVYYPYIYCPIDITPLPPVAALPPTPLPTPTDTPTPTPTPTTTATPAPTPQVSVAPDVINLGGCTKVKWDIQNVKEVYLNDVGVVGVSEREDCPTAPGRYTYIWRIIQKDGVTVQLERTLLVNPGGAAPNGPPTPPVQ